MTNAQPPPAGRPVQSFLPAGSQIAGYRVESFIGRGGMAEVYIATDLRLDRQVALKLLAPELSQNHSFRERFLRESKLAASLEHPNIIPIYGAGEIDGVLYIAMRLVQGGDLNARLKRNGRLEPASALIILGQVADALDAAHAHGLVHRDVKPANVLLASGVDSRSQEHVYLADFGLTKRATSMSGLTATGRFVGTMDYVSPEQIGGKPLDARTDVYALGCMAYQCLTGALPFIRDDEAALLWAHLMEKPSPISSHRRELSLADPVIAKAIAKSPEDRYDSCGQFVRALADSLAGTAVPSDGPDEEGRDSALAEPSPLSETEGPTRIGQQPAPPIRSQPEAATVIVGQPPAARGPRQDQSATGTRGKTSAKPGAKEDVEGPKQGGPTRSHRRHWRAPALVAAGVIALVLLGVLLGRTVTSGSKTAAPGPSIPSATALAAQECKAAVKAADQTLDHGKNVESALAEHTKVMYDLDYGRISGAQAMTLGQPSLTRGAKESAQFDQRLRDYEPVAAQCRGRGQVQQAAGASPSNAAAARECTAAITAADQTLDHAKKIKAALAEHTKVMNDLADGKISPQQATTLGQPSLDRGKEESEQFDRTLQNYQQMAAPCR